MIKESLTKDLLQKEFDSGLWHKEIAEKYNIGVRTIYTYVQKWDIKTERKNKKKEIPKNQCKKCGKLFTKLNKEGYCYNCKENLEKIANEQYSDSSSEIHDKIINLRKQGLSQSKIAKELNCSKSTIAYHCSQKIKDNNKKRKDKIKKEEPWKYRLIKRIDNFKRRKQGKGKPKCCLDWNKKLRTAVSRFRNCSENIPKEYYTYKDVIDYFGGTTVKCELTGRTINLLTDDYCIDHIVPSSKGGSNELNNMAFTIPEANAAKNNLTNEEFVTLCKEVCEHFGYNVIKV